MSVSAARRVDWFKIIADLAHRGFTIRTLEGQIDVPRQTIGCWRNGTEPRHHDGERLLRFWSAATGLSRLDVPYQQIQPSAAMRRC